MNIASEHTGIPNAVKTSFISILHDDLLWRIFLINADLYQYDPEEPINYSVGSSFSPLRFTLYASRVSRLWRRISLDSPTIWGRVIDLDVIVGFSEEGRNEILRRAGQSLLCIKGSKNGSVRFPRGASEELFFSMLSTYRTRVREINVVLDLPLKEDTWRLLEMAMENLEFFSLAFRRPEWARDETTMRETLFFGGTAPTLHELRIKDAWCHLQASWFSNIREFYLNSALPVPGVLEALNSNGLLEVLTLKNLVDSRKSSERQVVSLPSLKQATLSNGVNATIQILENIKAPIGCSFSITVNVPRKKHGDITEDEAVCVYNAVSPHRRRFCTAYYPTTVHVGSRYPADDSPFFSLEDFACTPDSKPIVSASSLSHKPSFSAKVLPGTSQFNGQWFRALFSAATFLETYPNITRLCLEEWLPSELTKSDLKTFASSFPNITVLQIDQYILERSPFCDTLDLFPLVHTLVLTVRYHRSDPDRFSGVISHLEMKKEGKRPITVLDLTKVHFTLKHFECWREILDGFVGLKILFQAEGKWHRPITLREFICGTDQDISAWQTLQI